MEFLLNRYRNLTVLLIVIGAQLLLIAYQVKTSKDVPLIRIWAVTAVTPIERTLEVVRRNTWDFVKDYFVLLHTRRDNDSLRSEVGRLKMENHYLKAQLSTADRAQALSAFQAQAPSKTAAARIIGNGTGANSKAVFVDRGSGSGIAAGMAVVTPDGIVGKIVAAYPTASLVLLITDGNFAAGVMSQKNHVRGTLKGQGHDGTVQVDYIQNEETVEPGEWFFTSGDDRIFPKGFPVGQVTAVHKGRNAKEIFLTPSGFQNGLEEVLIVLEAVHQEIPDQVIASSTFNLLRAPAQPQGGTPGATAAPASLGTDADRLKDQYRQLGTAEKHTYGEGGFDAPPDFTKIGPLHGAATAPPTANPPANGLSAKGEPARREPAKSGPATPNTHAAGASPAGQNVAGSNKPTGMAKPNGAAGSPSTRTPVNNQGSAPAGAAAPASTPVKAKPRPSGPLLLTDPTDADPSETTAPAAPPKPERANRPKEPDLNEFGERKPPKLSPAKRLPGDDQTEILPSAPPPRRRSNPPGAGGAAGSAGNGAFKVQPVLRP